MDAIEYYRHPTPAEIKFGEGAYHHLDIPLSVCVKPNGEVKRWVNIGGLRYWLNGWYRGQGCKY